MKRVADGWQEISWQQAFDEVEQGIRAVQAKHGRNSVAFYAGNPTVHNMGAMMFVAPLMAGLHSKNKFSATSVDQLPHMLASLQMFGHQLLAPIPDVDHTDFMLMLGANPAASNGSYMSGGDKPLKPFFVVDQQPNGKLRRNGQIGPNGLVCHCFFP